MLEIYTLAAAAYLMPTETMSWDELAARCERPTRLWRILGAGVALVSLGARFRRARGRRALRDSSGSAAGCRVPA